MSSIILLDYLNIKFSTQLSLFSI